MNRTCRGSNKGVKMTEQKLRLLIVIVNYKTPQFVYEALESLNGQMNTDLDKVVIVDNDSQDDSSKKIINFIELENWSKWVSLIQSGINGGFSAGNNLGMEFAEAEYYLLLNSDAFVRANAIDNLFKAAVSDTSLGIIGPRLEWPDGSQQVSCFYNLSPVNAFLHAAKTGVFTKLFRLFGVKEVAIPLEQHEGAKPDWLSFACVLLKGEMVQEIGLMDEGYFMYREDNDYCRRAIKAGWSLRYEPKARVVHLNKGSSNQMGVSRLPKYYFHSRARYFKKYYGRLGLFAANILWSAGRSISVIREMMTGKPKAFHSSMWFDIWTGFFSKQEYRGK